MVTKADWSARTLAAPPEDAPSSPSLVPAAREPTRLAGRYELVGLLGAGGMGIVYRAMDHELGELVALKMIRSELAAKPEILARFRQEVRLARRVTHANVARSYEFGIELGTAFLTMELIEGEQLSDVLERTGPMPLDRVVAIAVGVAEGLGAAHAAGIVHRDLKPENVMLRANGEPVVTDFGVALSLAETHRSVGFTVGTPAYMAPEQVEGSETVDGRADQFAYGVMLYEMLTGQLPFHGTGIFAMALARLTTPAPDPRLLRKDTPSVLASIVLRCLARHPADRFPDMGEVGVALSRLTTPTSVREKETGSVPPVFTPRPAHGVSVAVVPFRVLGLPEEASLVYAEELADRLSETRGLRVRPGAPGPKDESPIEHGRRLGVDAVVHASLSEVSGMLRLSVRISMVMDGFQIWARQFTAPEEEMADLFVRAAREVQGAFGIRVAREERTAENREAFELHMKARQRLGEFSLDGTTEARALLQRAVGLDPDNAGILATYSVALSRSFVVQADTGLDKEQGRALAERASLLAPERAEPRLALASVYLQTNEHLTMARLLREALDRAPEDPDAHEVAARVLCETLDLEAFLFHLEAALLHRKTFHWLDRLAERTRALHGDWEDIERSVRRATPPPDGFSYFGTILRMCVWRQNSDWAEKIDLDAARNLSSFERVVMKETQKLVITRKDGGPEGPLAMLRMQLARPGITQRGLAFMNQLLVEQQLYLGDVDSAVASLEESVAHGLFDQLWLEKCPLFTSFREHPRVRPLREVVKARAGAIHSILVAPSAWR